MKPLTASDLMESKSVVLTPDTGIHDAMKLLLKKKLTGAAVVDEDRRIVGILSEKDCLKVMTAGAFEQLPEGRVQDYMTQEVVVVQEDTTIYEIAHRFLQSHFRRLPVVDSADALLGVVSRARLLEAMGSMRDSSSSHGAESPAGTRDSGGVDTAMRIARGH